MSWIIISIKKAFTYKIQVLFNILSILIVIISSIFLWKTIYHNDISASEYMKKYTILSNFISLFYSSSIADMISEKVYNGTIELDLIRPSFFLKIYGFQFIGDLIVNIAIKGIPIIVLSYFYTLYDYNFYLVNIFKCIGIVFFGMLSYSIFFLIIGLTSFRFIEIWPFIRIANDSIRFLSGSFIPIKLFPNILKEIINLLPFQYLYDIQSIFYWE